MKTLTAAVIGLGRIGQGIDYRATDERVLTHAHAYARHAGFRLVGGVDPDGARREEFTRKYQAPAFSKLSELFAQLRPDVVSLCVPTSLHAQALGECLTCRPAAILCEKPLGLSLAEAEGMVARVEASGALLAVNYMRRFEPAAVELARRIRLRELGEVYKGTAWYGKGIFHNGSHLIDLLVFFLGEVTGVEILRRGSRRGGDDADPDLVLRFGQAEIYLLAAREECFSVIEVELMATRGFLHYGRHGQSVRVFPAGPSTAFPGYIMLPEEGETIPSEFLRYQYHVVDALHRSLTSGAPLVSSGRTALESEKVMQEIRRLLQEMK